MVWKGITKVLFILGCVLQKCSIKATMALFRANSSNRQPNPKNFSWAIANEHASKALARRDDFLAAITYVCLMTRISIRAKKAPSNLMTTSLWFLVLINPTSNAHSIPPMSKKKTKIYSSHSHFNG